MYRGFLKALARVWAPGQIDDPAVLQKVLTHMQAAQRGLTRLDASLDRIGPEPLGPILDSFGLRSLDQVDNLDLLQKIVVANSVPGHHVFQQSLCGTGSFDFAPLRSGFRLAAPAALTPPKRLKFDSVPGHHVFQQSFIRYGSFDFARFSSHDFSASQVVCQFYGETFTGTGRVNKST